jgi:hypothetical protein
MKVQEGEEILHELGPAMNVLLIWLFAKALPIGLAGGGVGFGKSVGGPFNPLHKGKFRSEK